MALTWEKHVLRLSTILFIRNEINNKIVIVKRLCKIMIYELILQIRKMRNHFYSDNCINHWLPSNESKLIGSVREVSCVWHKAQK